MSRTAILTFAVLALLGAAVAWAADRTWHPDLDAGIAAARKSGRPILVVTGWKSGI